MEGEAHRREDTGTNGSSGQESTVRCSSASDRSRECKSKSKGNEERGKSRREKRRETREGCCESRCKSSRRCKYEYGRIIHCYSDYYGVGWLLCFVAMNRCKLSTKVLPIYHYQWRAYYLISYYC